ncbi:MAG: aromatic amino acid hydroxylase [Oceanococcus sp.]
MHRHRVLKQAELIASLPRHLRQFVRQQSADYYSARDHAAWRFLLHQLAQHLKETAHPVYQEGLKQTGINLEHIPSIDEMNQRLANLGWAAVVVDGFIPPAIFMEFQARRVLPIALDMRQIGHLLYTPAPDIVHEAAGHAPFIVDVDYAEFLQRFGEVGMKAISTAADYAVYQAIRHLSIVKEAVDSNPHEIQQAQAALDTALTANDNSSEAALLARLHWWTVEYGLVGELDNYRLFGAGLLSSLGESLSCLDDNKVVKRPLTLEAVNTPYDITATQPQLFVARSCKHLSQVLDSFAKGMCFNRGGVSGLRTAINSASVCTAQYNSGLQVSGQFIRVDCDAIGEPIYLATQGPTQLAFAQRQLHQHGTKTHPAGFGSPIGQLVDMPRCLSAYSIDELKANDIVVGKRSRLEFVSGVVVQGQLDKIVRELGRNLLFSLSDCSVTGPGGHTLFDPAWGNYDMAVGCSIDSVWGGAADREHFDLYKVDELECTPRIPHSDNTQGADALYAQLRKLRQSEDKQIAALHRLYETSSAYQWFGTEWLLQLEMYELALRWDCHALQQKLVALLQHKHSADSSYMIKLGLNLLESST